ncbi:MAG: tetratricopeptide repeat protein [Caldilineaceae bacterium]
MAYSVETKATSPANLLREKLDRAEREVVKLDATNVESYLLLLDQIEQQLTELIANETDLRPELGRWDSLTSRLRSQPGPLVAAATKAGGLARLRQKHPPAEEFWWHLDKEVMQRRAQTVRRMLTTVLLLVVVLGGGWWALNTFFPPNPDAVRMLETNSQLEELIAQQRWEEALAIIETAQQELPNEPELILWEVVFAEQLGETERAQQALARAQALLPEQPVELWVQLGNQRLQVGDFAGAQAAGNEALALDPESAQATFLLGSVAEMTNDIATAIEMFDRTFTLAEDENPQLAVIARVRMGNLLQRAPAIEQTEFITPSGAITATATITATP